MAISPSPPRSETELLNKTREITGMTIRQLATSLGQDTPEDLTTHKGWVGELMEQALGATASSLPEPDFQHIGVELKTLPVNKLGTPRESTYVCTASLSQNPDTCWENSLAYKKLKRVLWLPVEADPEIALGYRRIGNGFLWSPDNEEMAQIKSDWKEINDMINLGEVDQISSSMGEVLQLRPKAANARAQTPSHSSMGEPEMTLPRGFYLRARFTKILLQRYGQMKQ